MVAALTAGAFSAPPADQIVVPRSEFEQMKKEMAAMRQELNQLKTDRAMQPKVSGAGASETPRGSTAQAIDLLNRKVDALAAAAEMGRPGETKFHLAGDANAVFTVGDDGDSNFSASFNPALIWHLSPELVFESKVEFLLEDDHTRTELQYAHLDWSLGDYVTLVGGKFLNPVNLFAERYQPGWINKLPSIPLGVALMPESNVGFQLRGVVPITDQAKVTLSAYVSNPPKLIYNSEIGARVEFDDYDSVSDHKALGGRVGLQIGPNFEVGYGFQKARLGVEGRNYEVIDRDSSFVSSSFVVTPDDLTGLPESASINALQHSVDLQASLDALKGRWTLLGQYIWTDADPFSYTSIYRGYTITDPYFGDSISFPTRSYTTRFNEHRDGGYVQLSYRGQTFASDFLNRLELIVRADRMDSPYRDTDLGERERITFGLDYWVTDSTVLKAAYGITRTDLGGLGSDDSGFFQFGISTGL